MRFPPISSAYDMGSYNPSGFWGKERLAMNFSMVLSIVLGYL
jgi:hypothetical protein